MQPSISIPPHLREHVIVQRKQHQLSCTQLSRLLGIGRDTVYRIENTPSYRCTPRTLRILKDFVSGAYNERIIQHHGNMASQSLYCTLRSFSACCRLLDNSPDLRLRFLQRTKCLLGELTFPCDAVHPNKNM